VPPLYSTLESRTYLVRFEDVISGGQCTESICGFDRPALSVDGRTGLIVLTVYIRRSSPRCNKGTQQYSKTSAKVITYFDKAREVIAAEVDPFLRGTVGRAATR